MCTCSWMAHGLGMCIYYSPSATTPSKETLGTAQAQIKVIFTYLYMLRPKKKKKREREKKTDCGEELTQ